jgi:hypothetical protein
MEMILCPNCGKLTGFKRALGFGTFFAVIITAGLWLIAIPFYPKRCITCGLGKSEVVPWYKTWRLAAVLLAGGVLAVVFVSSLFPAPGHHSAGQDGSLAADEHVTAQTAKDLYSPERIAEYCRAHPAGFYGAPGSPSGVSCPEWIRSIQPENTPVEGSRDDWKRPSFNLDSHLDHTLANAPFTAEERSRILQIIEKFADGEKQQVDRETLMSARIGAIELGEDGSRQVLVQGPYLAFCGASGNCPMWLFTVDRSNEQFRLALEMEGNAIILRDTFSRGFRDFATSHHMSAYQEYYSVYRWNGARYEQTDCYSATLDSARSDPAVIADCKK